MRWRDFDNLTPLPHDFFQTPRHIHFIGIGGIGMSALALLLQVRGHRVSGSDATPSAMLAKLRESGIPVSAGHTADAVQACNAVIYGSAIGRDNPERAAAHQRGVPEWHRAQLLAYFVNNAKRSVAVTGTHGKSTTSAMIAHVLAQYEHGGNPTAILGAVYPPFQSNVRVGDPDLVVVEADESDGSFTLLKPTVAVVTNVELEHLENYEHSEEELWRAFDTFVDGTSHALVLNRDDEIMWRRLGARQREGRFMLDYRTGLGGRVAATSIATGDREMRYELFGDKDWIGSYTLGVPGRHNVSNALAAMTAVGCIWNVSFIDMVSVAAYHLQNFMGVARRFELRGEAGGVLVYDDYAHHPTEVSSTLGAAREFLGRPITAIFQPHRYSRTQQLGRDFATSFEAADRVIITELYSAFEEPIAGVSGRIVYDAVRSACPGKEVYFADDLSAARRLARDTVQPGDALLTLGAGDITTLPPLLLEDLRVAASVAA